MELSKRLAAIGAMIETGSRVADIGTDHGYLPIWLVQQGKISSAIAMDINEGPLLRAKAHVEESGLSEKITVRKSDGFEHLLKGEADTAVIAGMGGLLMIRILKDGWETAHAFKELVLSPQSDLLEVRRYLRANGFEILSEKMVFDEGKYYTIMKAAPTDGEILPWSYIEEKYGKYLLQSGSTVAEAYLEKEKGTLLEVKEQLKQANTEGAKQRLLFVEQEIRQLEEALSVVKSHRG